MLSVALATYNGELYIKEQLESIARQEKKIDEIIIYDDCSEDNTVQLIEEFIEKNNTMNIQLHINKKNVGYIENFRKAIEQCSGDYIFLCDQDDIWCEYKTEKMIDQMRENDIGVLCTQYDLIDGDGLPIDDSQYKFNGSITLGKDKLFKISLERLLFGNIAPGCTYCFTKNIQELYLRRLNEPLIHDYSIALIGACLGKCYYYNEKTMYYRIHNTNSIGIKKKGQKSQIRVQKKKKPYLVTFLENYYDLMSWKQKINSKIILYFRMPLIKMIIKNKGF